MRAHTPILRTEHKGESFYCSQNTKGHDTLAIKEGIHSCVVLVLQDPCVWVMGTLVWARVAGA